MTSSRKNQSQRSGPQRADRLVTMRRVLALALVLGLHGADLARAQEFLPTARTRVVGPRKDPDEGCCLYRKYCPIKYESFLVEANICEGQFVWEWAHALADLVRWKCDAELYCESEHNPRYEVIRVTAAPGFGKSALLRYLEKILKRGCEVKGTRPCEIRAILDGVDDTFVLENVYWIKLDELRNNFGVRSTMLDDLKNDDGFPRPGFGTLPAFDYDDHAAPGVEFLVKAFNPRLRNRKLDQCILLIDSIDEIHPDSAKSLLTRLDDYIKERQEEDGRLGKRGFLRIFVIGRPEGFTEYYRIPRGGVPKRAPVRLSEPCFHSYDDLVCAARSVVQFNMFGGWDDPADEHDIKNMTKKAIEFATEHPWLQESFCNLSGLGDLIRFSNVYTGCVTPPCSLKDEYELKEIFFESLLARERDIHNRPTSRSQEYILLLEEIACRFARCHQIDSNGYFMVTPNDFVEINVKVDKHVQCVSYLAEAVLNRSGLVDLDSLDRFPRYRFYPTWVREHLLERHQRRLQDLAKQGITVGICSRHCTGPGCRH
jgi:hypothetical protein